MVGEESGVQVGSTITRGHPIHGTGRGDAAASQGLRED